MCRIFYVHDLVFTGISSSWYTFITFSPFRIHTWVCGKKRAKTKQQKKKISKRVICFNPNSPLKTVVFFARLKVHWTRNYNNTYISFHCTLMTQIRYSAGVEITVISQWGIIWYCYIRKISLDKTSTEIGWFLVTCPWSNSNVSRLGYHNAVITRIQRHVFARWLFKGKSEYITKYFVYGPTGD